MSHWFLTSAANWVVDADLHRGLNRLKRADGPRFKNLDRNIWKVPGPPDASYDINSYKPQVEGAEYIGKTELT